MSEALSIRPSKATLMLATRTVCLFWMSRSLSIISSRLNPSRYMFRFTASTRPVSVTLPPELTFPSMSASNICSEMITGIPSMSPSWPVSSVALGPSFSTVRKFSMDKARI